MINASAHNLGTESAFGVLARAAALGAAGKDIINLGIGQPDFRTPDHIVEAGIKALQDGAHGYTPSMGLMSLRETVAEDAFQRYGVRPDVKRIQIVPGGKPVMFTAMMLLGGPGHEILTPDPGFPIYQSAINYSGAKSVSYGLVEEKGFAFDAEDVLSKITDKTSLVIVNSPANPTGGITPRAEMDKFIKGMADFPHVAILSDEIYDRLVFDTEPLSLLTYPGDTGQADYPEWLVKNLCDDGLAYRLWHLAGKADRFCRSPGGKFPFLCQCTDPACRRSRLEGRPILCRRDADRLSPARRADNRPAERAGRGQMPGTGRGILCLC